MLTHRFLNSPGTDQITTEIDDLFNSYGYDKTFTSEDYSSGSYAALGNYLAAQMITYGLNDNALETSDYSNAFYTPDNPPLILELYQDNTIINPNKWQPLAFDMFQDQSGNTFPNETPDFLSPEWGSVKPFSLKTDDLQVLNAGFDSYVYNDPGPPVYIQNSNGLGIDDPYKWHFALVASWSSHLDPDESHLVGKQDSKQPGCRGIRIQLRRTLRRENLEYALDLFRRIFPPRDWLSNRVKAIECC